MVRLKEIRVLLAAFVRQHRFFDGLLAMHIENGNVQVIIERLQQLV